MAKIELNFRSMACPMPIMETAMAFKKGTPGDVFIIVSDDPAFESDILAWCNQTGNSLNSINKEGKDIIATVSKK